MLVSTAGEVPMLKLFRRALATSARRTVSETVRAATKVLQELAAPDAKPPRKRRAAAKSLTVAKAKPAVRKTRAVAKPRKRLAETVAWIEAGGMPAHPPVARVKTPVPRGASFRLASYANDQGERSYKLYIPAKSKAGPQPCAPMPLVVMLHGCGQTPDDFAAGTRMNALAEEFGLLVAYPTQPRGANANKCWNWFKRSDQARGAGEPSLIAGIARTILRDHPADPARVYIAGLSAGGSAAIIAATAYPDLFAAAGVHSGLPAGAAHNAASGFIAMKKGAPGDRPTVAVPTIVFHGDADTVVHPRNGRFVVARSLSAHPGLKTVTRKGRSPGGRAYSTTTHRAGNGKSYCEHWVVEETGHAWSGGNPAGSYTDPAGPDASREMLRFFLRHRISAERRRTATALNHWAS
jgi:poly(hydroxyalkanoate) depolymerase family esterase